MPSLIAKGNDGAGTDPLAGITTPDGFAGAVVGSDGTNYERLATETSLAALLLAHPINQNGVPYVTTARAKFRDSFLTFDTTNNWNLVQTGSGQTISVAGVLNGARYLNIASGTTINSETIIVSKQTFKAPSSVIAGISLSQRIANCDAFVEIVEVDTLGNVLTNATIPSSVFLNATNAAGFRFTGVTATTQTVQVRQDGLSEESAALTLTTTAATGTSPNFLPAGLFEITLRTRDVQFSSLAVNGSLVKVAPNGSLRQTRVPNPDGLYALRIRVKNGSTAPASSTDVRIHSIAILDDTRITVDFGSISGIPLPQNSLPIFISGSSGALAVNNTGAASTARVGFVAGSGIWFDDFATTLAANATFTGTSRDATVTATATAFANAGTYAGEVRLSAESDVTGTLWLEVSRDNTNWRRVKSVATTAVTGGGFYAEIIHQPSWRYWRAGYTNGATIQGRFTLNSLALA